MMETTTMQRILVEVDLDLQDVGEAIPDQRDTSEEAKFRQAVAAELSEAHANGAYLQFTPEL